MFLSVVDYYSSVLEYQVERKLKFRNVNSLFIYCTLTIQI